ncbi:glycoside hydrolase family 10 protein [Paenibacillus sp. 1P03SA]|uniref:glycoside hydrolase family 10 protein n=1 Tax=Paenibacillus sp. 1P03SA TaxID=3132294 RepID=UPI0039A3571D
MTVKRSLRSSGLLRRTLFAVLLLSVAASGCISFYGTAGAVSGLHEAASAAYLQHPGPYRGIAVPPDSPKSGAADGDPFRPADGPKVPFHPQSTLDVSVNESVYGSHVRLPDGTLHPVAGMDQERKEDALTVFTSTYGMYTTPFDDRTIELIVTEGIIVDKITDGKKGTYLPKNGYVLSGTASTKALLQQLNVGDSLTAVNLTIPVLPAKYVRVADLIIPLDRVNGPRNQGEAVLFDSDYGASTRTNPWGIEVTIENGRVTAVKGLLIDSGRKFIDNDSPIPKGGYVLSVQSASPYYADLLALAAPGLAVSMELNNYPMYFASKMTYDAFNPRTREDNPPGWDDTNNKPYPGHRGAEQLIVYDSSYGPATGTNPWGGEAAVNADGKIIANGGNNRPIPAGGFVLSGHGSKMAWLSRYAAIGATVKINRAEKQVLLIFTPQSYLDRARITAGNAEQAIEESKRKFMDVPYDEIRKEIRQVKQLEIQAGRHLEEKGVEGLTELLAELDAKATRVHYMNIESRTVENRGIWIRPKEKTLEEVKRALDKIKAAHLNSVYLETFWNGYTIYPTKNKITAHNPMYGGFDVLQAYLDEGKKRGLEIHAWVENFFVGGPEPGPIVERKPEWSLLSRKGQNYQEDAASGFRYYFINPALDETHDFLLDVYKELLGKYDVDGLHLDYARYPGSGDFTNDFGYDTYTRSLFQKKYGTDPVLLHPGDALWAQWVDMRVGFVDKFVFRLAREVKKWKPQVKLTAAVWPEYEIARGDVLQDSMNWVKHNLIDNVFPMSYKLDTTLVVEDARKTFEIARDKSYVTIGVGSFIDLTRDAFTDQIAASHRLGISGSAVFEYESFFDQGYDKNTVLGVYRNEAVVPDRDPARSLASVIAGQKRKVKELYLPYKGIDARKAGRYTDELEAIVKKLGGEKNPRLNPGRLKQVRKSLASLVNDISSDSRLNAEVKERVLYDLKGALKIAEITSAKSGKGAKYAAESDDAGENGGTQADEDVLFSAEAGLNGESGMSGETEE